MRTSFFKLSLLLGLCFFAFGITSSFPPDTTPRAVALMPDNPPTPAPTPTPLPVYDIDSPESIHVVVNKLRPLPEGFTPSKLVAPNVALRSSRSDDHMMLIPEAATALEKLFAAASAAGHPLVLMSAYRSEETQRRTYTSYKASVGEAKADQTSARPGYSEHQTGLAADVAGIKRTCSLQPCFANTSESKWIADNAHLTGYIVRYPDGKEEIPGYSYEPWHLRYVGIEVATIVYNAQLTLEEFFDLPPAPDYP